MTKTSPLSGLIMHRTSHNGRSRIFRRTWLRTFFVVGLTLIIWQNVIGQDRIVQPKPIIINASALVGAFTIALPDVQGIGFDDVYGSRTGISYGGEIGLGWSRLRTSVVFRYRRWHKAGRPILPEGATFEGDWNWDQLFASLGVRHYILRPVTIAAKPLPFLGLGVIHSRACESADGAIFHSSGMVEELRGEARLHGMGYYIECGCDVCLASDLSLRAMLEYSDVNLILENPELERESNGGGGIFMGIAANIFF